MLSRLRAQKTRTRQAPLVVVVCMGVYSSGIKSADRIKQIRADGWYLMHVVGSHHQFKHLTKAGKVTVPHPKKDLPLPTARSILKQAGL